jgi:hypothetical protein
MYKKGRLLRRGNACYRSHEAFKGKSQLRFGIDRLPAKNSASRARIASNSARSIKIIFVLVQ